MTSGLYVQNIVLVIVSRTEINEYQRFWHPKTIARITFIHLKTNLVSTALRLKNKIKKASENT